MEFYRHTKSHEYSNPFTDIHLIKDNSLIDHAKSLGYSTILVLSKAKTQEFSDFKIISAKIIKEDKPNQIIQTIKKLKKQGILTIFCPKDDKQLRFILEKTACDMVTDLEKIHPFDHLHYKKSGLNQVLSKIARDNKKTIVFNFKDFFKKEPKVIGRLMFNLKLCKKFKINHIIASFAENKHDIKNPKDIQALKNTLLNKKIHSTKNIEQIPGFGK